MIVIKDQSPHKSPPKISVSRVGELHFGKCRHWILTRRRTVGHVPETFNARIQNTLYNSDCDYNPELAVTADSQDLGGVSMGLCEIRQVTEDSRNSLSCRVQQGCKSLASQIEPRSSQSC